MCTEGLKAFYFTLEEVPATFLDNGEGFTNNVFHFSTFMCRSHLLDASVAIRFAFEELRHGYITTTASALNEFRGSHGDSPKEGREEFLCCPFMCSV
jgi:hypothetical protein